MISIAGRRPLKVLIAASCLAAGLITHPSRAQDPSSPIQFWLSQPAQPAAPPARPRPPAFRPRASNGPSRRPATPPAIASSAFVVAVFGDGFGYDTARGLVDAFAQNAQSAVFDGTDEARGLAQEPIPNWASAIDAAVTKAGHVDSAVMMIGSDDLHSLPDGKGGVAELGSLAWRQAYGMRVEQTAAAFRDRHVPLIWIGLPLVRDSELASRFADLNAIIREHAPAAGATFVDSWEAFADDAGQYSSTGPDVNGQDAKLRRNDGARFTRAGARKLASFVEPSLKREQDRVESSRRLAAVVVDDSTLFDQALEVDVNAQIRREAGLPPLPGEGVTGARTKNGPVLELTTAPLAAGGRLATFDGPIALTVNAEAILASGLVPPAQHGRADDFTWPQP